MKSRISDYIMRWRHTRGYGVHSPVAFRIVKECIRPDRRYGLYADAYVDHEFRDDSRMRYRLRLLIRLVNLLGPRHIWMPGADRRTAEALRRGFPHLPVSTSGNSPKNADFIAVFGSEITSSALACNGAGPEVTLIVFDGSAMENTSGEAFRPTLTITSGRFTLYHRRPGMDPVKYSVI